MVSLAIAATAGIAQGTGSAGQSRPASPMNDVAERYVKLVLALGQHDADYVDAYYGPPEWKQQAESRKVRRSPISPRRQRRCSAPSAPFLSRAAEMERLRRHYLQRQLSAVAARIRMLKGERLSFDEESRALYDAVAPTLPESHFQEILDQLEQALPGRGTAASTATRRSAAPSSSRARSSTRSSRRPSRRAARGRSQHVTLPPDETLHGRVRHRQVVERLQLVPGQLPQPDPGQHRPADLHRSRRRSRVPRGLSRVITSTTRCSNSTWCADAAGSSSRSTRCSRRSR